MVVKSELDRLGLQYANIELGEAEIYGELTSEKKIVLDTALKKQGLELMDDMKSMLIEKIKIIIIELIHYSDFPLKINLSDFLTSKLNYDYTYLASLFSAVQGTTIEHFFIYHKIERVKELLVYDELNLKEIAYKLHYSSVAHLKQLKHKRRISLENL